MIVIQYLDSDLWYNLDGTYMHGVHCSVYEINHDWVRESVDVMKEREIEGVRVSTFQIVNVYAVRPFRTQRQPINFLFALILPIPLEQ
jgi:hypothetical protein